MWNAAKVARLGFQFVASQARKCSQNSYGEKSINSVTLLGRAGSAPQKRGTEEHPVVVFSMATNTYHRHLEGEISQHVQWHRISVFRPLLRDTVHQHLAKGQRLLVRGSISYYTVQDTYNNTSTVTSIIADDVIFLSRASQSSEPAADDDATNEEEVK
ncbi:single-stranded DNA-binding protein, mitochondrial-like isoform X2 [Pollicipes pollicipes]|uniref:single-stranded DNA-binding protein, mitochondrial-like isoform X2 n=1 Tax=Pollicipes pollicipes TaxID=41117 RepID=UPI001884C8C8|nr:single-stranded DNA-binding protein, mitochondrial-like isoform X2 [Pollicipes pollicipes]